MTFWCFINVIGVQMVPVGNLATQVGTVGFIPCHSDVVRFTVGWSLEPVGSVLVHPCAEVRSAQQDFPGTAFFLVFSSGCLLSGVSSDVPRPEQ